MFSLKEEMQVKAKELRDLKIEVTSRWLREKLNSKADLNDTSDDSNRYHAKLDVEDIDACDTFVLHTVSPLQPTKRGGRHWETGYAYAKGKSIILCGPRENVFHYLPGIKQFDTWQEVVVYLNGRS